MAKVSSAKRKKASVTKDRFQAVIDYVTEYSGVKGAVISDREGLVLAGRKSDAFDPEFYAAFSLEILESLKTPLSRLVKPDVETLMIKTPEEWLTLAWAYPFLLVVAAERHTDDLLNIRISRSLEMITTYIKERRLIAPKGDRFDTIAAKRLEEINV